MPTTLNDDNKAYEKLIKRFPLRPIRNDEQNDQAVEISDELFDRRDSLSVPEKDYLEVLTDLIAKYESKWDSEIPEMSPRELIAYLMEQNGLAQKDLVLELGSPSRVSEFLRGERDLSLAQARRLAERFRLDIRALIDVQDHSSHHAEQLLTVNENSSQYEASIMSLRNFLVHQEPVSYRLFFKAVTLIANEQDAYVMQLLNRPVEEADFATVYCTLFNEINLWMVTSKLSSTGLLHKLKDNVDVASYMSFVRPEFMAWEHAIQQNRQHRTWLQRHNVVTFGDFLHSMNAAVEQHPSFKHSNFWSRCVNPHEGQAAFERFTIGLYEELNSTLLKKK